MGRCFFGSSLWAQKQFWGRKSIELRTIIKKEPAGICHTDSFNKELNKLVRVKECFPSIVERLTTRPYTFGNTGSSTIFTQISTVKH